MGSGTVSVCGPGGARRWSLLQALEHQRPAQLPVAANQTSVPVGPVMNTIGPMQGRGRLTLALIVESPALFALKSPVLMLVTVAVFPAPMLWQLTSARKSGKGLVPCNAGGTG